jgi:hypothetical protein
MPQDETRLGCGRSWRHDPAHPVPGTPRRHAGSACSPAGSEGPTRSPPAGDSRQTGKGTSWPGAKDRNVVLRSRRRQGLQAVQEHHEGESVRDKVLVPKRAPYGTVGARRLYVDVRVLLPVPLEPPDLVRRSGGNLLHGASIAIRPPVSATAFRNHLLPAIVVAMSAFRRSRTCRRAGQTRYHRRTRSCRQAAPPYSTAGYHRALPRPFRAQMDAGRPTLMPM